MNIEEKYKIRAKKSLGQNFLIDEKALDSIVESTSVAGEKIVEVGPGYGALTLRLLKKSPKSLTLLELDSDMIHILEERKQDENWGKYCEAIDIQMMDVLKFIDVPNESYRVIANIPYYITSPILHHFLYIVGNKPISMTILMQRDVADKILRQYHHKKPKSSVLSLFLAKKANIEKICDVPAASFSPAPKVDSTVLKFTCHANFNESSDENFMDFIKKSFCEPRKKLFSNLVKAGYNKESLHDFFAKNELAENLRPEDLHIEEYIKMSEEL